MNKLFVAACCLLLAGCAAPVSLSGSPGADPMETDGQSYVGQSGEGFQLPASQEPITKGCTIKNETVTCF